MGYVKGADRKQGLMLPDWLEDYVEADNDVRALDAFVDSLDFSELGFKYSTPAETGRPAYNPGDLLKLYLYGYLNGIDTSRRLAAAAKKNVELMWLLCKLTPDFHTISNFRKDNAVAILEVFRRFVAICRREGLFGGKLVGIDGSKFQASNSKDNNYTKRKLKDLIEYYEEKIQSYLREMDANDLREVNEPKHSKEELQGKIENIRKRLQDKQDLIQKLEDSGQKQISTVDPDSRRMKFGDGTKIGYNTQASVDEENGLILDFEVVTDGNDLHQLHKMSTRAREILQSQDLKIAADSGYHSADEIVACEKDGIEVYVSRPKRGKTSSMFEKSAFVYDKQNDFYFCPAGEKLHRKGTVREHGRLLYYYETNACKGCTIRALCTARKVRNRRITRCPGSHRRSTYG